MDALEFLALHSKNTVTQWGRQLHYIYEAYDIFSNTGFMGRKNKWMLSAKRAVSMDITDINSSE